MTYSELDRLQRQGGNTALVPILEAKGMVFRREALPEQIVPERGCQFHWSDNCGNRTFTWVCPWAQDRASVTDSVQTTGTQEEARRLNAILDANRERITGRRSTRTYSNAPGRVISTPAERVAEEFISTGELLAWSPPSIKQQQIKVEEDKPRCIRLED